MDPATPQAAKPYDDLVSMERAEIARAVLSGMPTRRQVTLNSEWMEGKRFLVGEVIHDGTEKSQKYALAMVYAGENGQGGENASLDDETLNAVLAECREAGYGDRPAIIAGKEPLRCAMEKSTGGTLPFQPVFMNSAVHARLRLHRRERERTGVPAFSR